MARAHADEPHWREIRAELGVLENRRSSLTLETSARIDPKSEWFPVLVNAIHVHMLLLNSVYCDIVRPIDIDPHVRAKMLGLLFPGGESLDRSSDTYLPEHEAEAGSEGRARGVRTRYDRILGEDDAHDSVESHAPSHEKVRMPFEGSAQSAASATDASPAMAGTAGGSPDASSQSANATSPEGQADALNTRKYPDIAFEKLIEKEDEDTRTFARIAYYDDFDQFEPRKGARQLDPDTIQRILAFVEGFKAG